MILMSLHSKPGEINGLASTPLPNKLCGLRFREFGLGVCITRFDFAMR